MTSMCFHVRVGASWRCWPPCAQTAHFAKNTSIVPRTTFALASIPFMLRVFSAKTSSKCLPLGPRQNQLPCSRGSRVFETSPLTPPRFSSRGPSSACGCVQKRGEKGSKLEISASRSTWKHTAELSAFDCSFLGPLHEQILPPNYIVLVL